MPENPLLPDAELRALLALTKRCASLDASALRLAAPSRGRRGRFAPLASREALLAGTTQQLQPGDLLVGEQGDTTVAALASSPVPKQPTDTPLLPALMGNPSRLLLAAAMAAALQATKTDRVVLAFLRAGAPASAWIPALTWAQEHRLPLVLVCADPSGTKVFRSVASPVADAFSWSEVNRIAGRLQLPILCTDGEDAVAVYRVAQESLLRARTGGGPALLWAMLPTAKDLLARGRNLKPVHRLTRYLRARDISL